MPSFPQLARMLGESALELDGTDSIQPEAAAAERRAVHKIELLQCEIEEADARIAMLRQEIAADAAEIERLRAEFERARPKLIDAAIATAYQQRKLVAGISPASGQRVADVLEAHARRLADEEPELAGFEALREFLDELPRRPTTHN